MTDMYVLAFVAVLLIVGVVMVGVVWVARAAGRTATNPTPRKRRRIAQSLVVFGFFSLGFRLGAAIYGAEFSWLELLVAIGLIASGLIMLRDLRNEKRHGSSKMPR